MFKLLIVDDEQSVRYSFRKILATSKYSLIEAGNADEGMQIFRKEMPDLVILDIEMPGKDGIQLLKEIKELAPSIPVIIITAYGSGDRVINAMKYGAYEYVEKPFDIPRLKIVIEEALSSTESIKPLNIEGEKFKKAIDASETIVGESPEIKEVFKLIGRVAASDANILIVGESGTGKELVARAIHKYSDRSSAKFVALNCAAIPETLLESELFGFEKGAFTGADKQKAGKFEEASGGTLFLDEVGDMSLPLQSKLLRVLQDSTIERLGGNRPIRVDVRIVAATNRNLEEDIRHRLFREDLYYRLKVISISLPPLRMRKNDIPLLCDHFIRKHCKGQNAEQIVLHPETLRIFQEYSWPGNIRQLENVLKRALILAKGNLIAPELLKDELFTPAKKELPEFSRLFNYLSEEIAGREGEIYSLTVELLEKDLILWALNNSAWNQVKASKILGISRVMLHERIEKYELKNPNAPSSL